MSRAPVRTDIAKRLKAARQRIFSTAAEAAEALDMKAVTLRAHENGQNGISTYDLERYARRFAVSLQWLMTGKGAQNPDAASHVELGEMLPVEFTIEAGAWIPEDHPSRRRHPTSETGLEEAVPYTDPRYPSSMVTAVRVQNCSPDAHYINGTILFIVEISDIGTKDGDHVLVLRTRGDFVNISVRRVVRTENDVQLLSLTGPDDPVLLHEITKREEPAQITAVIVGSITRRPAMDLDLESIRLFEQYERSRRVSPREWRSMIREAKGLVDGRLSPGQSDTFDDIDSAQRFLDATKRSENS